MQEKQTHYKGDDFVLQALEMPPRRKYIIKASETFTLETENLADMQDAIKELCDKKIIRLTKAQKKRLGIA